MKTEILDGPTRQKISKKRSLCVINVYFESFFNDVDALKNQLSTVPRYRVLYLEARRNLKHGTLGAFMEAKVCYYLLQDDYRQLLTQNIV